MALEPPRKKAYRPPQIRSEKILVSNLFATICTVCSPSCLPAC